MNATPVRTLRRQWSELIGLIVVALFLSSLIYPAPSAEANGQEIIRDNGFRQGFILWKPVPGKHLSYGEFPGIQPNAEPVWGLSQWSSKFPIQPEMRNSEGNSTTFSNSAKHVALQTGGADLVLGANSAIEYGKSARKAGEPWVHLLVEQEFKDPPLLENLSAAVLYLEARLTRSTNLHRGDYDPGLHAAQFQVFFTVQNRNSQSQGYGDMLWFGIPIFDSRHRHPPEFKSKDFGGTEKFIFTPAATNFTSASAHDGEWIVVKRDLLPLMHEALETAWARGFLPASRRMADYAIGGMNMGWELPGTFAVELQVRNLSLSRRNAAERPENAGP